MLLKSWASKVPGCPWLLLLLALKQRRGYLPNMDKVAKRCNTYGLKLVIDYHYGRLSDNNYLTETPQTIDLWLKLTKRFLRSDNEPPILTPNCGKMRRIILLSLSVELINNVP